jgi:hypothetical protein
LEFAVYFGKGSGTMSGNPAYTVRAAGAAVLGGGGHDITRNFLPGQELHND